jgi:DNA-binding transcriptional ArsR family regulator
MMETETTEAHDRLSVILRALADRTRRAIIKRLAQGEATVNELAEPFAISLPAISRHLKVLEEAGLISRSREAQWRPCRLEAAPLQEVANFVAEYQRFWDERMGRLDDLLRDLQAKEEPTHDHEHKSRHHDADVGHRDRDGAGL